MTAVYIHDIKFEGDDDFTKKFNECSDLYQKSNDPSLSEEEREEYGQRFIQYKTLLEMGAL